MLTILRALDRNVKLNDDSMPIDFTKILSDIENLEKLTLHPEIYPILDTFKSYAKSYQFAQEISKAKALENQVGGGALATTLEGRIKVFLTNRLFKKLFAFIPYVGDNAAITKALQSAIKDLKYPSEITLETLKVLNKADLDKGFKPIKDKEPRFEYKAHTPLSDKELQDQIKGNTQILTPKDTSEIEAIASNPLIQNMERQAKYNEELTQKISQFEANKENIQQDILNNLVVATQEIKQNTELLKQLAQQLTHNNPIHTPNKSIIKAKANNETYFITTDKNNITAIEKQELQLAQPKTYDELMQRDKNQNATLESYRDQYADIAEIKEKEAQKQLLLEYKPEIKETSVKDTQNMQDINFNILSQKNTGEVKKLIVKNLKDQELIGATITSKEGINATLSINSIGKMISDKAIQKSLDNGFSREEHLKAVLDIRPLFENAIRRESTQDKKGNGLIIHRLESNIDEKSLALITLKESQQHGRKIYTIELQLSPKSTSPSTPLNTKADLGEIPSQETKGGQNAETPIGYSADIIPQNPTKAQSEYFNPFMNEYEKIKEIKKLHTQDDNLIRVMKVEGRNDYIEPLSNMSVSKEYLQKQTAQSLKENITQAILGNQTQLKALQQGYNTYHLSHFQKEVLESALDIANNPTKLKEYKLQGLQKQLNNLNNNEAYHIEKGREYDKARYAKDRQELEKEIYALKGTETNPNIKAQEKALNNEIDSMPQINFNAPTKQVKTQMLEALKPIFNQTMTSSDGVQAYMSLKSLSKMTSPQAIQKSIDNGFSREEHLKAVLDIERLFKNAKLQATEPHKSGETNAIIHRLNSELENGNALITTKESLDTNKNRVYSVELELTPRFDNSSTPLNTKISEGGFNSQKGHQEQTIKAEPSIAKTDTDIIPQKLTERIKNDLDSNDYAEMLKSLKQLENKQAEIDTFTNETNLILNTLEKQETEKYEKIVSPLFDKYPIMKEFYNERDINTHIYFKRFKNEFLERYNTQYDFFTLDEKAFLAKYPNFTQQDYKEATTQNLKALKDKNVSINEYVSFAKEYIDIVNNPVFEKMAKEIDSVDKKYWDTHFEMSDQRDSKVNEIIAILKKNIDSIDIANKADVSIDNFHKLGRYLAFMKQPEFGFANKLTFTKTGFFGKFLEQTDIKQRELLGELLSVEKLLGKEGKANRVLQDRLFTIFRLMRGEELLDREIKDVPLARELIEKQLNIKPIKEFGTNYAEHYHSGESAIQKLISEAQAHKESGKEGAYKGQVAGAFHRKELGDIDLVWGDSNFGLAHILQQRTKQWGEEKALRFISHLSENIQKGHIVEVEKGRIGIKTELTTIILDKKEGNNFVITAFRDSGNKKELESLNLIQSKALTSENAGTNAKESPVTSLNQDEIIPQQTLESTMQKFNYDEKKAKDLLEWHKDSSPLTKDENGLPKVFYHGTRESIGNKEILTPKHTDDTGQNYPARFFSSSHNVALSYTKELPNSDNGIYKVFLNAKNPLVIDFQGKDFVDRSELADKIYKGERYFDLAIRKALEQAKEKGKPFDSVIYKNVRDERYGRSKEISDTIAIFNPNQIKHIDNKGSYTDTKGNITKTKPKNKESTHKYFNENSPNIMYANPQHLGAGILSGSAAGIETDENGNIVGFNPAKFAAGFLGGVVGSKAVTQGFKHLKNNPQLKEAVARELANTLAHGFDKAKAKYPLLSMLEPRYIVQNEKGRIVQAKSMLKLAKKESQKVQLKTYKTLKKYNIESLEIAQEQEYKDFVADVWDKKGYEKAPNILKIATLPQELKNALGVKFDEVFLTKKDLSHFRTARKANYNQALSENEILEIPSAIAQAKNAYIDTRHKNFFIVFADKQDNTKINFIHFNADELGNYIITTKKADKEVLNDRHYKQVGSGIEPHIP